MPTAASGEVIEVITVLGLELGLESGRAKAWPSLQASPFLLCIGCPVSLGSAVGTDAVRVRMPDHFRCRYEYV